MDEKQISQFVEELKTSVTQTITELNNKNEAYEGQIAALQEQLSAKETEIAELNEKLEAAQADVAAKDQAIADQTAELNELKETNTALAKEKKLAELNAALTEFSAEEQALAQAEIDAFKADPDTVEINSITSKICVEMVRKDKEARASRQTNDSPDIFGSIGTIDDNGEVDIY